MAYIDPGPAPQHHCINANCGCDDLVSAGTCSEWCAENTVELVEIERGEPFSPCACGHDVCYAKMPVRIGGIVSFAERGVS